MKYVVSIVFFLLFSHLLVQAQDYTWFNPAENSSFQILSQGWSTNDLKNPYDRLPSSAEGKVREAVWNLSRHAAGITIRFASDAPGIKVRYQVSGNVQMPHMPATGVSGVDLYMKSNETNGQLWCKGGYSFKDTIVYTFDELNSIWNAKNSQKEYELYLPLYNHVEWMEIGIPEGYEINAVQPVNTKPVVVYGTSIAQGACASRPGMAWTSILQRKIERPVINLAFSGNGRLEPELIDYISEIEASAYILDCLPNLTSEKLYPEDELKKRIRRSVNTLKEKRPNTPILLVQHAGYSDAVTRKSRYDTVERINAVLKEMYHTFLSEGMKDVFFLSKDEINMCMDCTVDGTHQNDLGMQLYGNAYGKKVSEILE